MAAKGDANSDKGVVISNVYVPPLSSNFRNFVNKVFSSKALLVVPFEKNYKGLRGLHSINDGRVFFIASYTGNAIRVFDHFPNEREYSAIPDKTLFFVCTRCYKHEPGLYQIQSGKSYYKDLSYVGRKSNRDAGQLFKGIARWENGNLVLLGDSKKRPGFDEVYGGGKTQ